jgi:hypothetical protein
MHLQMLNYILKEQWKYGTKQEFNLSKIHLKMLISMVKNGK